MIQGILWNSDTGITDFHGKELMICIQNHLYPSLFSVILDGIFHKIGDDQCQLHLIHLHFHVLLSGNGPETLQNQFRKIIDIHHADIHVRYGLIHLYQSKQIRNDFVFPVNFLCNVFQELPVQLCRYIILCKQRICQYLHGCNGGFQFMGHIGHKLLPGIIQYLHPSHQIIERIHNMLCLQIVIDLNGLVSISGLHLADGLGDTVDGGCQYFCQKDCQQEHNDNNHDFHNNGIPVQNIHSLDNGVAGYAG